MKLRQLISALLGGTLLGFSAVSPSQAATLALADVPLFLVAIKPSIMVMLDNSGSMKEAMYTSGFNPSVDYYGIFEAAENYEYDATIAVNSAAYSPVSVDTTKTGAFVASNCTPSNADLTCWSGRYLNWLTTRRIDSSRMVMVGGKLESTAGYAYGGSYQYKIVGNNEYADRDLRKTYSGSSNVSPVPDGVLVTVYSPADANNGAMQTTYDPYGKISVGGSGGFIFDSSGAVVGEFDKTTISASVDTDGDLTSWSTVTLKNSYTNPVVIAKPPTFNGGDPGVVRIKDVDAAAGSFKITMQEWEYKDGNHTSEDVSYIVMEAGHHTLPDSIEVEAGTVLTNSETVDGGTCRTSLTNSQSVSFTTSISDPVVISSVMTFNGPEAVTSRIWGVGSSGFTAALQEEQDANVGHNNETIGYIAFEEGELIDATNEWSLEADSVSGVTQEEANITFNSTFNGVPTFVADMQTMSDDDTAVLRLDGLSNTTGTLHIEEEESCPNDDVTHSGEEVGYVALRGAAELNITLAVDSKPAGLLQDISDGVRLGVSFYRYNPDANDIYNQNVQGGTLRFKIPINPFVKKPTNTSLPAGEIGYTELDGYIGTAIDDIVDAVNKYPLVWGTTPIAENLWEVIQYFEQDPLGPHYTDVVAGFPDFELATDANPERDPFYDPDYGTKLYCTSPSVVIFTDGYPYKDADIPTDIAGFDGDSHPDDVADSDINAQGKDNLDDVAKWGFCEAVAGCPVGGGKNDEGTRDLRDSTTSELAGTQYLRVFTVGFADGNIRQVLQDAADNAGGLAYAAEDGKALETALEEAITAAMTRTSASSVAVNTGSITASSKLYQAIFDGETWSGDIEAYAINSDGSVAATPSWGASEQLPVYTDRVIFTYDGTTGQPFQWDDISGAQQTLLGTEEVLDYLRGDTSNEEAEGGTFRDRAKLLGDFINSAPVWVGAPNFHYPDSFTGYTSFQTSNSSRTPVVYAGSNDGMLHAFDAADGEELFAYVPAKVYERLAGLANPNYVHKYTVDGSPTVVDAYFSNAWHTVLAAGLNAGGQGIFALDVTDPNAIDTEANGAAKVLWEFDDSYDSDPDDSTVEGEDLGYTYSQPNIVRLHNGSWAAVFGNGYNNTVNDGNQSTSGNAVLYIVDVATGNLVKKIDTGEGTVNDPTGDGRPNGLATVAPVDVNGDSIVDYVYGGDLFGNMWKFDLTNANPASWVVAFTGSPLYTACTAASPTCSTGDPQPITTRPRVGLHPTGDGYMVYFGTGKYFENNDDTSASQVTQSFYGIWDKDGATLTPFDRDDLLSQQILKEVQVDTDTDGDGIGDLSNSYRITSDNLIDWSTDLGWYMDLINTENENTDNKGERQISNSILRNGKIIFTTMLPEDNPCSAGGTGWLMELDVRDGSRLAYTPFDTNNDGKFDEDDYVGYDLDGDGVIGDDEKIQTSGIKSKVGILPTPAILNNPGDDGDDGDDDEKVEPRDDKLAPGTTGKVQHFRENRGPGELGRQSWRELAL